MLASVTTTALSLAAAAARRAVLAVFSNIRAGELTIVDVGGDKYTFPKGIGEAGPTAALKVNNDLFWLRLAAMSDLGFAEAYMFGDVSCTMDELRSVFQIFLLNRKYLAAFEQSALAQLASLPQRIVSKLPRISLVPLTGWSSLNLHLQTQRANIAAHYDLSNTMFKAFLSPDMTYSCAIFEDLDGDTSPGTRLDTETRTKATDDGEKKKATLPTPVSTPTSITRSQSQTSMTEAAEQSPAFLSSPDALHMAQMRKLEHIICQLRIPRRGNVRVLELGTGWGSLSLSLAARFPNVSIDTLTLSSAQASHVRSILRDDLGLRDRVRVHELSYSALQTHFPGWRGAFDRVVSVEMVEAVGRESGALEGYFNVIDWALREKYGVGVIMGITIPEGRYERYLKETDFIQKWIFPGGHLPTVSHLVTALHDGSDGRLTIDSVSNIGPHYARTLREWMGRFCTMFGVPGEASNMDNDKLRRALLEDEDEVEMDNSSVEIFRRKWIYYFIYCEIGFTTRSLGDHILTFTREANTSFDCSVFD